MSMSRLSRSKAAFAQSTSPKVVAHSSFVGLSITLSNPAAVVTIAAGGSPSGPFDIDIVLTGTDEYRYPDADSMHILYNAPYIEITWDVGTLKLFQKG